VGDFPDLDQRGPHHSELAVVGTSVATKLRGLKARIVGACHDPPIFSVGFQPVKQSSRMDTSANNLPLHLEPRALVSLP
jgi:hypothetical protein